MPKTTNKWDSKLEKAFHVKWLKDTGIPIVRQHRFHPTRRWAFDFAFPERRLAIEIQGYGKGHAEYNSMHQDYEKNNEAVRYGWQILYFMSKDLTPGTFSRTIRYIKGIVESRPIVGTHTPSPTPSPKSHAIDRLLRPFE